MPDRPLFTVRSLRSLNSFGIEVKALRYCELQSVKELLPLRESLGERLPFLLGGGSNILFTRDVEEPALGVRLRGIETCEDGDDVHLHVAAGENWHELTRFCVDKAWGGIENLSLIPGQVGTAPVQNIGAYGVELKDTLTYVDAFDWKEGESVRITNDECAFSYRDSIFKSREIGRFLITAIGLKLNKAAPVVTHYGAIQSELQKAGRSQSPTYADVARAVINIRQSKLPDPEQIGNAGSFFKNPVISRSLAEELTARFPELPQYPAQEGFVKVAAGWLIEKAGWKGHDRKTHGVHDRQALVLVNRGGAQGKDIYQLACDIQSDVAEKFNIKLEMEVNIYR